MFCTFKIIIRIVTCNKKNNNLKNYSVEQSGSIKTKKLWSKYVCFLNTRVEVLVQSERESSLMQIKLHFQCFCSEGVLFKAGPREK